MDKYLRWCLWTVIFSTVFMVIYYGMDNQKYLQFPNKIFTLQRIEKIKEIRENLKLTKTINFYKNLFHHPFNSSVKKNIGDIKLSTSAARTTVEILQYPSSIDGLLALIIARDYNGKNKLYGGDVFRANLVRAKNKGDGIVCNVKDFTDGSYQVTAPSIFNEEMLLQIQLLHSSESLYLLMNRTSTFRQPINDMKVTFNSSNGTETSFCSIELRPDYNFTQLCNYSDTTRDLPWYCVKTATGECGEIIHVERKKGSKDIFLQSVAEYFEIGKTMFADIGNSGLVVKPYDDIRKKNKTLPQCYTLKKKFNNFMSFNQTGYFMEGYWRSLTCNNTRKFMENVTLFEMCMMNKTLYLFGDSTSRQWFDYFEKNLNMTVNFKDPKASMPPRKGVIKSTNGTIILKAHGMPMRTVGLAKYYTFLTKTIDEIKPQKSDIIIVISMGLHYHLYNPKVFVKRIRQIKKSIIALIQRFPTTRIFFRDISMHVYTAVCPSPWLSYRFNQIIRHEFNDVKGVYQIDTWEMTSLRISHDVHPTMEIVKKQIALFQSFICKN